MQNLDKLGVFTFERLWFGTHTGLIGISLVRGMAKN
jgi:hypothetical protein